MVLRCGLQSLRPALIHASVVARAVRPLMKTLLAVVLSAVLSVEVASAEVNKEALAKLTEQIGEAFWSPPEKRLVRATIYKKGKNASDPDSENGRGDEKIGLRYATAKEAGTLAVPEW